MIPSGPAVEGVRTGAKHVIIGLLRHPIVGATQGASEKVLSSRLGTCFLTIAMPLRAMSFVQRVLI